MEQGQGGIILALPHHWAGILCLERPQNSGQERENCGGRRKHGRVSPWTHSGEGWGAPGICQEKEGKCSGNSLWVKREIIFKVLPSPAMAWLWLTSNALPALWELNLANFPCSHCCLYLSHKNESSPITHPTKGQRISLLASKILPQTPPEPPDALRGSLGCEEWPWGCGNC